MKIFGMTLPFWTSNRKTKKEIKPKTFEEYVVRGILAKNSFGIVDVTNLRSIKSLLFEKDKYPAIVSLIQNGNFAELTEMSDGAQNSTFREDLEIMQFQSQDQLSFIATVYDSDELWQDPQIIDIFTVDSIQENLA